MHIKPPEVNKCCFCLKLRRGIILFGYINIIFSLFAVACLIVTTELKKTHGDGSSWLGATIPTVLFSIFGMSVLLNILLLVASYQKDISMLRLYNYYSLATTLGSLALTLVLLSRLMILQAAAAFLAIGMQCYVIVLVRSEIVKLERKLVKSDEEGRTTDETIDISENVNEEIVDIPDSVTLL